MALYNYLVANQEIIIQTIIEKWKLYRLAITDIFQTVVLPLALGVVGTFGAFQFFRLILRTINPPNAEQLHKEALGILKKGDGSTKSRKIAKRKLKKSIAKDPNYTPSRISLAAIQLYQEDDPKASLDTIQRALDAIPLTKKQERKELKDLKLDAEAMDANLGHMVKAGSFANPYLGDICSSTNWR